MNTICQSLFSKFRESAEKNRRRQAVNDACRAVERRSGFRMKDYEEFVFRKGCESLIVLTGSVPENYVNDMARRIVDMRSAETFTPVSREVH